MPLLPTDEDMRDAPDVVVKAGGTIGEDCDYTDLTTAFAALGAGDWLHIIGEHTLAVGITCSVKVRVTASLSGIIKAGADNIDLILFDNAAAADSEVIGVAFDQNNYTGVNSYCIRTTVYNIYRVKVHHCIFKNIGHVALYIQPDYCEAFNNRLWVTQNASHLGVIQMQKAFVIGNKFWVSTGKFCTLIDLKSSTMCLDNFAKTNVDSANMIFILINASGHESMILGNKHEKNFTTSVSLKFDLGTTERCRIGFNQGASGTRNKPWVTVGTGTDTIWMAERSEVERATEFSCLVDADGDGDYTDIQSGINSGAEIIYVKGSASGTVYTPVAALSFIADFQQLHGIGKVIIKSASQTVFLMAAAAQRKQCKVVNIKFEKTAYGNVGLSLARAIRWQFIRCIFDSCNVSFGDTYNKDYAYGNEIIMCDSFDGGAGAQTSHYSFNRSHGNKVLFCNLYEGYSGEGIRVFSNAGDWSASNPSYDLVMGCYFEDFGMGLRLKGTAYLTIAFNQFDGCGTCFVGNSTKPINTVFYGNTWSGVALLFGNSWDNVIGQFKQKQVFFQCTYGTDGMALEGTFVGGKLTDAADHQAYITFKIPNDFAVVRDLHVVVIAKGTGNIRREIVLEWGKHTESHDVHTATSGIGVEALVDQKITEMADQAGLFSTNLAREDYVGVKIDRTATHGDDTVEADVIVLGVTFEYISETALGGTEAALYAEAPT